MPYDYSRDAIKVAVMLDTSHPRKDGKYPVRIRVTWFRQRQYYPTGKALTASEWDALQTTKSRELSAVRRDIESSYMIVRETIEALADAGRFSFDTLNGRLKRASSATVGGAFETKCAEMMQQERVGNAVAYRCVLRGIERFAGTRTPIEAVTVEWLRRYERFLRQEGKRQSTIGIHMRHIRAILNDAKRYGEISDAQYPFGRGRYEIQAGEGRKMALTLSQIGQIAHYDDGSEATARYRDYWLFLYLCNGINVADFVKLRYCDIIDGEVCFVRQKTERTTRTRKEIRVIVTEQMQAIIDRWGNPPQRTAYIFPILDGTEDAVQRKARVNDFTKRINKRMTEIGERLDIGRISTYTARHSFATVLKRAGTNIAYISESLGHQDLKTTENYLAAFEREERQKNAEILTRF